MINIRNTIIRELYNHIQKPIIPNTNTQNRPPYPFSDYSITALIVDESEGNYDLEDVGEDVKETISLQNKISFSFNTYSDDEIESYNLAKDIWNWFKFVGVDTLIINNIAVVEVMSINNRTMLEVDSYEFRYGFDLIVRYAEDIEKINTTIDYYSISGEVVEQVQIK